MRPLFSWFNDRTGVGDWCRRIGEAPVPGGASWCKVLPAMIVAAFCIEAITGFFLWAFYSPSAQSAWESVYYLQYDVAGGWLLRAMHHYAAHVLVALLLAAVVLSIVSGRYRARELVFWATVGLGLCALAAVLTGDLLYWDQSGYAATKTRTGFLTFLPWVGGDLLKIAIGGPGPALGQLALTRFFALHVGLFSAAFILLLVVWKLLANKIRVASAPDCDASPYWPAQAWRGSVASLAVLVVVLLLCCQHGVAPPHAGVQLLSPADADPTNSYDAARPEWFLTGVYEFSHLFPGQWGIVPIFIIPGALLCVVLAMPFLARHIAGHVFNVIFAVALVVAGTAMTCYSYRKDGRDPLHQKAIAAERERADRAHELIRLNAGIPPAGALSLLRDDPKMHGPRLFAQNCGVCHNHATADGADPIQDIKSEKPTAPDLAGYATRQWLTGLLDPKQINGPEYFGNTAFRGKKMAGFVKETLSDLDAGEQENLKKVIMAVSAEAHLPTQADVDKRDAKLIAEGQKLLVEDFGCVDCHKFHDDGKLGDAPELTGYGSPEWIAGITSNPAAVRFYSKRNDRMPAYAASSNPAQNTLSHKDIELLVNWLRGQWKGK